MMARFGGRCQSWERNASRLGRGREFEEYKEYEEYGEDTWSGGREKGGGPMRRSRDFFSRFWRSYGEGRRRVRVRHSGSEYREGDRVRLGALPEAIANGDEV